MSSISSGLDPAVKYQRLSAEYVKIRNQVAILKAALLDEQAKSGQLQRELTVQDTALRKAESERDSLAFRNDQLVKRVESLQESLEAQMAAFGTGKGKKKHKEANLRLVAENSRMQHPALGGAGGPSATDPQTIMEEELERKIVENGELHSKLFDVERRFDEATAEFLQRIDELQRENTALRSSGNGSGGEWNHQNGIMPSGGKEQDLDEEEMAQLKSPNKLTNGIAGKCGGGGSRKGAGGNSINGCSSSDCGSSTGTVGGGAEHFCSTTNSPMTMNSTIGRLVTNSSRSSDGKPSDSAISLDSVERADAEDINANSGGYKEGAASKRKMLEDYFTDRIATLTKTLQHATGRATYYKQECEELIRQNLADQREIDELRKKISGLEDKCGMLYETLETTQQNYEEQMRQLYEHMAGQDAKIADQADRLMSHS